MNQQLENREQSNVQLTNMMDDLLFEELEDRIAPEVHGGCATSSSCNCSSSSCVVYG